MSDYQEQERPWSFYVQDMLDFAEAVLGLYLRAGHGRIVGNHQKRNSLRLDTVSCYRYCDRYLNDGPEPF